MYKKKVMHVRCLHRRDSYSPQVLLVETALVFFKAGNTSDGVEYEIVVALMTLWKSKIGVVTEVTSATESWSCARRFFQKKKKTSLHRL